MSCEIASVDGAPPREMCVIHGVCGNGVRDVELGEACDDGNTVSGDGCSSDCSSDEMCGNHMTDVAAGETCDPPALGQCDEDCHIVTTCGNGRADPGEECDYGAGDTDNGDCRSDCVFNRCGDGHRDIIGTYAEECDGGTTNPMNKFQFMPAETDLCNIDCTNARCGDHKLNRHFTPDGASGPEQCDEGENPPQDCPYGKKFCVVCDSDCQFASGQVHVCGDSVVDAPNEGCDHGNTTCGSCTRCQTVTLAKATGSIVAAKGSEVQSSETFTVADGVRSVTFQFTDHDTGSNVGISFQDSDNEAEMAQHIADAIASTDLLIDATPSGSTVMLRNQRETSTGNQPITSTVAAPDFHTTGMTGGAGADCAVGQTCQDDSDCLPTLVCNNNVCTQS